MSEAQLGKLEKLEKRRQQLAKWKLKKTSSESPTNPPALTNKPDSNKSPDDAGAVIGNGVKATEPSLSVEDLKKLERQKKLEEWKRKKQQANQGHPQPQPKFESPGMLTPTADSKLTSIIRLDAWKQDKSSAPFTLKAAKPLSPFNRKRRAPVSNVFSMNDEEEEAEKKPKFCAPRTAKSNYNRASGLDLKQADRALKDEKDELDIYLEALNTSEPMPESKDKIGVFDTTGDVVMVTTNSAPGIVGDSEEGEDDESDRLILARMKSFVKGKELAKIDHEQVAYAPFRKDFYIELPVIGQLSPEDVKAMRIEMDGIKVTGKSVPKPIFAWDHLSLSPLVLSVMEDKLSYKKPTSIQSQALPAIMSGRDFMGVAKTGSGKTLAFVLPLLSHVQAQPPLSKGDGPIAVLLTPTRELALQIYKQLSYFTKKLAISACCCYGGSSIEPQIAELKKGSQVVVATPGRLIDLLAANNGRVCNLQRVTYVVLDEADRMFDFGFEPQVNKIFSQIRPDRQSILFSATFAKKMESLARAVLVDPVEVVVGGISVVAPEITQRVEFFEISDTESTEEIFRRKLPKLLSILEEFPGVKKLVFVEKQDSADGLLVELLAQKIPCVAIHGGKEQIDRKHAIREFSSKDSGVDVLIATSVAARGLDVKGLDLVVNFDPPNHMEDYVHRVGRTGRAGRHGDAYTFVTSRQERPITDLVKALRLSKVAESEINPQLKLIADCFLEKVKSGKEKFRFGFGGNGLLKLEETRTSSKLMERKAYDVDVEPKSSKKSSTANEVAHADELDLPEFKVIEGRAEETAGPDFCKFHSRVTINDLPQKARWIVMNADSLAQIIEATSTSITNKGQYYAPKSKIPTTVKQSGREVPAPPKLYLLIEGLTENAVSEANHMIRRKMIDGLEQTAAEEGLAAPSKYIV